MKGNETVSSYIAHLIRYRTKLMNTGRVILGESLVTRLLNFVSTRYQNIRCHIGTDHLTEQILDYVRNTLLEHEAQTTMDAAVSETTAMATSRSRYQKNCRQTWNHQNNKQQTQQTIDQQPEADIEKIKCYYCLRKGHYQSECKVKSRVMSHISSSKYSKFLAAKLQPVNLR